jgi:amino acid adenylation domain-containing protein
VLETERSVDPAVLAMRVAATVARHDVLRSSVRDGGVDVAADAPAPQVNQATAALGVRWDAAACWTAGVRAAPLLSVELFAGEAGGTALLLAAPALVADAATLEMLAVELVTGWVPTVPPLPYASVAAWLDEIAAANASAHAPGPARVQLPFGRELGGGVAIAGHQRVVHGAPEMAQRLGIDAGLLFLAAWSSVLARYGDVDDIDIAVVLDGRWDEGLASTAGPLARHVPVTLPRIARRTTAELLACLSDGLDGAEAAFGSYPWSSRANSATSMPYAFEQRAVVRGRSDHVGSWAVRTLDAHADGFGLKLSVRVDDDAAELTLHHDADLLTPVEAETMLDTVMIAASDLADRSPPVGKLRLANDVEDPGVRPDATPIESIVTSIAERHPDRVAVEDGDLVLTYSELDARASALAGALLDHGVGPEQPVGLCIERGAQWLVAALAVWRAQAAFMPLDPEQPPARLRALWAVAGGRTVVRSRSTSDAWLDDNTVVVPVDAEGRSEVPPPAHPRSLAYLMPTSGTTGRPKLVAVEHRSVRWYADALRERLVLDDQPRRWMAVSTLTADLVLTSVLGALVTGGTLDIVDAATATDPPRWLAHCERHPADCLKITPSHLAALLTGPHPERGLPRQHLVLGGEPLGWALVERIAALDGSVRIHNHYGPTETTIGCTLVEVNPVRDHASPAVPIGGALGGATVTVGDLDGTPLPAGVQGEVWIEGPGVARGYAGDPAATAERFAPCSHRGQRRYRSGDSGRLRTDGMIDLLGRTDDEVKIRGFRVAPAELEAVLATAPGVLGAAVVVSQGPTGVALHAYVTGPELDMEAVESHCRERLPDHLLPATVNMLDRLPRAASGKLDRAALPRPRPIASSDDEPQGELEASIASLFSELLGLDRVGRHDDFFRLGGHSLLAMQVVGRISAQLDTDVPLATVFEAPTVAELAALVTADGRGDLPPLVARPRRVPSGADE